MKVEGLSLKLALDTFFLTQRQDALTGLKAYCQAGRPDWPALIESLGKITREMFFIVYKMPWFHQYLF